MIVDNPDALKAWLTSILEPLCDADPSALAKYVYALVKKEKPGRDLKTVLLDQLDVFLQHDTKAFVEILFRAFESKDYLKWAPKVVPVEPVVVAKPPVAKMDAKKEEESSDSEGNLSLGGSDDSLLEESFALDAALESAQTAEKELDAALERSRKAEKAAAEAKEGKSVSEPSSHSTKDTLSRPSTSGQNSTTVHPANEQTLTKFMPVGLLEDEAMLNLEWEKETRDRAEQRRQRRARSWERRQAARHRELPKAYQPYAPRRRMSNRRSSPTGGRLRYRNRSPPSSRLYTPSRSTSSTSSSGSSMNLETSSSSRSRSPPSRARQDHNKEVERKLIARDREQREKHSLARESAKRERSRDRSPSNASTAASVSSSHLQPSTSTGRPRTSRRCRDYDEKGFCLKGDMCTFDHGVDPVILEDPPLTSKGLATTPVQEYNPMLPEIWPTGFQLPQIAAQAAGGLPIVSPMQRFIPSARARLASTQMVHPSRLIPPPPPPPPPPAPVITPTPRATYNPHKFEYKSNRNHKSCTLEVKKIPRGLNEIAHLNNHFGKFGKVVNIRLCYNDDPEAALITYSKPFEAHIAYKSTEAVLGNRFIRVYWHNPEKTNPQTAATNQLKLEKLQHPASQNKVFINKENLKASTESKESAESKVADAAANASDAEEDDIPKLQGKKPQTPFQEHKRAQDLLDSTISHQKHMIKRLESGKLSPTSRKILMQAVTESQESIESLTLQVAASGEAIQEQIQPQKARSYEEAQKELLDVELDLFNKQKEGADVTDLEMRAQTLRRQFGNKSYHKQWRRSAPYYNQYHYNNYGYQGRYNPMRYVRPQGPHNNTNPHVYVNQSVDHRPRALAISGFEADETENVSAHFRKFGKVVGLDIDPSVPELTIEYRVRAHAEYVIQNEKTYLDRLMSITWTHKKLTPYNDTSEQASTDMYIIRRSHSDEELDTRHLGAIGLGDREQQNNGNSFVINTQETNGTSNNGNTSPDDKTKYSDTKKPAADNENEPTTSNSTDDEDEDDTDQKVYYYKGKPIEKFSDDYYEAKLMGQLQKTPTEQQELTAEEEQKRLEEMFARNDEDEWKYNPGNGRK